MNPNYINLTSPITKIKTIVYTKMSIQTLYHILGNNQCEFKVEVQDESGENIKTFYYLMSGVDYLNWTTDNYLINWVQNKIKNEVF